MAEKTAVLIPSFNEAKTIGGIVERLKGAGWEDVYVVDDGSSDGTASIAGAKGARVISSASNKGKGVSLREGFSRILKEGFDRVLVMDGDGQHSIDDIGRFYAKMDETGAGIVVGNRMSATRKMPFLRIIVNHFMSYLISVVSGQSIPDTQCGFRLIKKEALKNICLEASYFETESELLIKAARSGCKIESVPVKTVYSDETSSIRPIKDTIRFMAFMLKLVFAGKR